MLKTRKAEYVRNFIFGVEDSLVSTVGLVSGIAAAGVSGRYVFLTGMVLIFVEGFSMGVGSLLSENSTEEYVEKQEVALSSDIGYGLVMFLSYLLSGFILVAPYLFFSTGLALVVSVIVALTGLFALGLWIAKVAKIQSGIRRGITMVFLGGAAIILGILVGQIVDHLA